MTTGHHPTPELQAQVRDTFPDLDDQQADTVAVVVDTLRGHNQGRHLHLVAPAAGAS